MTDDIEIACPRCHQAATVRFYGPCAACLSELRAAMGGPAREVETTGYEPKVNVVPNHVATKE